MKTVSPVLNQLRKPRRIASKRILNVAMVITVCAQVFMESVHVITQLVTQVVKIIVM